MALTQDAEKIFVEFQRVIDNNNDWSLINTSKGVNVYQKFEEGCSFSILKGVGVVQSTVEKVLEAVTDPNARGEWDRFYDSGHLIKWVNPDIEAIVYMKSKTYSYMVWPRDSCLRVAKKPFTVSSNNQSENNEKDESTKEGYLVVGRTIEDPQCPLVDGYVRGNVMLSGFHILPIESGFVQLTYIYQVDASGWLPTSLVEIVNKYRPLSIIGIRKYLTGTTQEILPESLKKNNNTVSES